MDPVNTILNTVSIFQQVGIHFNINMADDNVRHFSKRRELTYVHIDSRNLNIVMKHKKWDELVHWWIKMVNVVKEYD